MTEGDSVTLSWAVDGATELALDNSVGQVSGTSAVVTPTEGTQVYTLSATNAVGTSSKKVTFVVGKRRSPPHIRSFVASQGTLTEGESVTLSWAVDGATALTIDGVGPVSGTSQVVTPAAGTQAYTLRATNASGTVTATASVVVSARLAAPTVTSFVASPQTVTEGESVTLSWAVDGATALALDGVGPVSGTSKVVTPAAGTQVYTLRATNASGTVTATASVVVSARLAAPTVTSFVASPQTVTEGESVTLSWAVQGATALTLDGVAVSGTSKVVTPAAGTQVYTLRATNASGTATATATVMVSARLAAPTVSSFVASPQAVTEGESVTLSWAVQGATALTLDGVAVSGTSKVVTPAAGTQVYTLRATNAAGTASATVSVVVNAASTAQYYVTTTGNDANPGTVANPWRTIQKAMNSAPPGSTVNIRGGTYRERLVLNVSGTATKPIIFQNYGFTAPTGTDKYPGPAGGEAVLLDYGYLGTYSDGVALLNITGRSYVTIQGLTFQNSNHIGGGPQLGIKISNSSFVNMKHNRVLNVKNLGAWDGNNATELFWTRDTSHNIVILGNEIGNCWTSYGEALTVDWGSYNVTVERNWIHDVDAIGLDVNSNAGLQAHDIVIRNNLLEWIGLKRDGTIWYNNPAQALYVMGGYNVLVEGNVVRDSCHAYAAEREPIYAPTHDVVFRNNVAYRVKNSGIKLGTWYSNSDGSGVYNISFLGNTLYQCGDCVIIRPAGGTNKIVGNIIFGGNGYVNTGGWYPGTVNYNLWYSVSSVGPDANKLMTNPLFTDTAAGDFSLRSGSPAVGAGDPAASMTATGTTDYVGGVRIFGGRIDVGAYEQSN